MNELRREVRRIFCYMTLLLSCDSVAQSKPFKAPFSSPTPQTDFAAERREKRKSDAETIAVFNREMTDAGEKPGIVSVDGSHPGTTGLSFLGVERKAVKSPRFGSLSYGAVRAVGKYEKFPTLSAVVNLARARAERWVFANYFSGDGGYIFDPLWLNEGRTLVIKHGIEWNDFDGYYLYVFDKPTKRIFRLDGGLGNKQLTVSPTRRYLTYVSGGSSFSPIGFRGEDILVTLHVWDAQRNYQAEVATNLRLQGSYSWKSEHELVYSLEEKRGAFLTANSYIYNAATGKSRLWHKECQAPVFSPDGRFVVYATRRNATKNLSPDNAMYVLQTLKSGRKRILKPSLLGEYDMNRQVKWSTDSRLIFSILRVWPYFTPRDHRLFMYNRVSRKAKAWSVLKPHEDVTLLTSSSRGARVFLLRQRMLSEKLLPIGSWDYEFKIDSINTRTQRLTTLWRKKHIQGLAEDSIIFNQTFLKD